MINQTYIEFHTYYTVEYDGVPIRYNGSIYDGVKAVDQYNFICTRVDSDYPYRFKTLRDALDFVIGYRREHDSKFAIIENFKGKSRVFLEGSINKDTSLDFYREALNMSEEEATLDVDLQYGV